MKVIRLDYKLDYAPANLVAVETPSTEDPDAQYMPEAEKRLALLRRDGWRIEYLNKWFLLQVGVRKLSIDTPAVKDWAIPRFKLFCEGNRDFRRQSFLRALCIQQRFPDVSDGELMLACMITSDAFDYYKEKGSI